MQKGTQSNYERITKFSSEWISMWRIKAKMGYYHERLHYYVTHVQKNTLCRYENYTGLRNNNSKFMTDPLSVIGEIMKQNKNKCFSSVQFDTFGLDRTCVSYIICFKRAHTRIPSLRLWLKRNKNFVIGLLPDRRYPILQFISHGLDFAQGWCKGTMEILKDPRSSLSLLVHLWNRLFRFHLLLGHLFVLPLVRCLLRHGVLVRLDLPPDPLVCSKIHVETLRRNSMNFPNLLHQLFYLHRHGTHLLFGSYSYSTLRFAQVGFKNVCLARKERTHYPI